MPVSQQIIKVSFYLKRKKQMKPELYNVLTVEMYINKSLFFSLNF
jgi:hypothetical protein